MHLSTQARCSSDKVCHPLGLGLALRQAQLDLEDSMWEACDLRSAPLLVRLISSPATTGMLL